jgi:hypothetical protein
MMNTHDDTIAAIARLARLEVTWRSFRAKQLTWRESKVLLICILQARARLSPNVLAVFDNLRDASLGGDVRRFAQEVAEVAKCLSLGLVPGVIESSSLDVAKGTAGTGFNVQTEHPKCRSRNI